MKKFLLMLLTAVLLCAAAAAEIHLIENEAQLPEGWHEKELFRLTALDTDRSDAMLLQCGGENMMIDGGYVTFYPRLEEYFAEQGITEFKYLYNTHPDSDHIHGLSKMMNSGLYQIGGFYSAVKQGYTGTKHHVTTMSVVKKHEIPYVQIYDGDVLTLGGATLTVVRCDEPWGVNNRSAACQVRFGNSTMFLAGDCGNDPLKYFVQNRDHALLQCDIMKAQHHGINGIVDEFYQVAQPEFVFVPNAKANLTEDKQKHFEKKGAWFNGDGTIIMETDGIDWYIWQLPNWEPKAE